jgi:hypothetical protein
MATASSGTIPDVLPSQVLSVSPSLPTNKLLDNLTVNRSFFFLFCLFILEFFFFCCLEKSKAFTIFTTKL